MDATQRVRAMLSFVQAADQGSFAAAARTLGISAAAVGKNVAGLEAALGVRLMNRSTRAMQLTSEGRAFLDGARAAIDALDSAIDGVVAQRAEPTGRVRITSGSAFGYRYLLPLLPELAERYPGLVMDVELDDRRVDLVRDGFDLGLRGGLLLDSSLVSRHICHLPTILVASPDYLARHGIPTTASDLEAHKLIAVRFLNGNFSPWQFRAADGGSETRQPTQAIAVVSHPEAATEMAVAGMGIAQIGAHHAWPYLQTGRLKSVLGDQHESGGREMALQYPHRALLAPRVRVTVAFLLDRFAQIEALHLQPAQWQAYHA